MKTQKLRNGVCFALSGIFLLAGVGIYVLAAEYPGGTVFTHLRNFGADFFWLLSLEFVLAPFIKEIFPEKYLPVLAVCSVFCGCLFEYLQAKGICKGTGDVLDCAVYLTAAVCGCLMIKKLYKRKGKKV